MDREEFAISAYALNSTLIGMCKRNVLGSMRTHTLIHLNLFVPRTVSGFWRTPSFSRKSTQVFVHEAPGAQVRHCPTFHYLGQVMWVCLGGNVGQLKPWLSIVFRPLFGLF